MRYSRSLYLCFLLIGLTSPSFGQSLISNGDFSADLDGWKKSGDGVLVKAEGENRLFRLKGHNPRLVELSQTIGLPADAKAFEMSYRVRYDVTSGKREWHDAR